jgi:hypothetical protein
MEISRARHPGRRRHPASEQSRRILCTGELWRVRTSERSGTWSIRGGSQWSDLSVKTPVAGGTPPCDEVRGVGEGQSYQSRHGRSWAVHPVQSGVVAHTMGGSWIHHSAQTAPTAGSNPWTTVARASVRRISIRDMLGERMREMRLSRFLQLFEVPSRRLNCPPWVSLSTGAAQVLSSSKLFLQALPVTPPRTWPVTPPPVGGGKHAPAQQPSRSLATPLLDIALGGVAGTARITHLGAAERLHVLIGRSCS